MPDLALALALALALVAGPRPLQARVDPCHCVPRAEVVHLTSPLCHWSWGYEPVVNRLRLLFGKQIDVTVALGVPHTDREQWLKDYEMTDAEAVGFVREIAQAGELPLRVPASWSEVPQSAWPATAAVLAARLAHGPEAGERLARRLLFAYVVEGLDTAQDKVIADAVAQCRLDDARMRKASEGDALDQAMADDMQRAGHGANFFSLLVRDGKGTTVTLERAYDPAAVERAVEFVAGKKLKRAKLPPIENYVADHGPVPLLEVQKVYALSKADAKARLAKLEKKGVLSRRTFPGTGSAPFWFAR